MNLKNVIHKSWFPIMGELDQEPLVSFKEQILPNISYQPTPENIFRVFSMPLKKVKVVILGQDPYSTPGDAVGYSFVNGRNKTPKSLQIIYEEILKEKLDNSQWDINKWTEQGVFLLNSALTVETGKPGSHLNYWKGFTQKVISFLSSKNPCIWVMWGIKAQSFIPYINNSNIIDVRGYDRETIEEIPSSDDINYLLTSPHPTVEAYANDKASFYGCDHFYMINKILQKKSFKSINW